MAPRASFLGQPPQSSEANKMPHIDDTVPFRKRARDIADKVESRRMEFNEGRRRRGMGTLAGLERLILKRKQEAQNAKRHSY